MHNGCAPCKAGFSLSMCSSSCSACIADAGSCWSTARPVCHEPTVHGPAARAPAAGPVAVMLSSRSHWNSASDRLCGLPARLLLWMAHLTAATCRCWLHQGLLVKGRSTRAVLFPQCCLYLHSSAAAQLSCHSPCVMMPASASC